MQFDDGVTAAVVETDGDVVDGGDVGCQILMLATDRVHSV